MIFFFGVFQFSKCCKLLTKLKQRKFFNKMIALNLYPFSENFSLFSFERNTFGFFASIEKRLIEFEVS